MERSGYNSDVSDKQWERLQESLPELSTFSGGRNFYPGGAHGAVEDSPLDFPLWGAMGGAVSIALGLALAQPEKRVLVLTGDGEMLMGIGSLATVALQQPANLVIVVLTMNGMEKPVCNPPILLEKRTLPPLRKPPEYH